LDSRGVGDTLEPTRRRGISISKGDVKKARYRQETLGEAAQGRLSILEFRRRRRLKESQSYPNKPQCPGLHDTKDTSAMSSNGLMEQQERREGSVGGKEGMVVGEDCQFQAVVYSDAVEDAREMILYGPLAHRKLLSDFLVGAARHDPFDNLQIAG
jgi:hypothetical protein